jgi:hypothetical protein
MKRDGPKAPTAIHGLSGLKFLPVGKANLIADCLENRFTPHDPCDKRHEERVEAYVQALLDAEDNIPQSQTLRRAKNNSRSEVREGLRT